MHTPLQQDKLWMRIWSKLTRNVFIAITEFFFPLVGMVGSCIAAPQIVFIISFEKCFLAFNWVIEPLTNSPIEAVRGWYSTVQDIQHTHRTTIRNTQHTQHTAESKIYKTYNTHTSRKLKTESKIHNIYQSKQNSHRTSTDTNKKKMDLKAHPECKEQDPPALHTGINNNYSNTV